MKKLFLASSFRNLLPDKTLKSELLKFIGKKPKDILIGHIPNAGDVKEDTSYIKIGIDNLKSLSFQIADIDLRNQDYQADLVKCDCILVNGGNTYYLLDLVRKSGFDRLLNQLLDQDKIYIGISAGSYICCPTIEQSGWKKVDDDIQKAKVDDLKGLNYIPFLISAHYNREKYREAVADGVAKTNLPVVALYDSQAVVVQDDKYKIVGDGPREFFNGFKENWNEQA